MTPERNQEINPAIQEKLFSLKPADLTLEFLKQTFATKGTVKKPLATFQDKLTVPKDKLGNKEAIRSNAGRYLFNMFTLEKFHDKIPYVNESLNSKNFTKLNDTMTTLMLEDDISVDDYVDFLNRVEWLTYSIVTFTLPAFDPEKLSIPPKTKKLKAELVEKYQDEIEAGDPETIDKIEKALIESAKEELKGTDMADWFDSGARGSWDNNFKNMVLMRGLAPKPNEPGKFNVSLNNLSEGSVSEEQALGANILLRGAAGRAIETRVSGYISKQLTAAFQGVTLGPDKSDCKTPRTLDIILDESIINLFRLRYIVEKGKLVLLDSKTIKNYVGRPVKLRSPLYCRTPEICEKCFGRLPYILGIKNIGLTFNGVGERLKGLSMKAFHDTTIKLNKIDIDEAIVRL